MNLGLIVLFIGWVFLPATLFIKDESKAFEITDSSKSFKVIVYHLGVISPLSLYKYLKDEDYYFVLYDIEGNVIFKPSLFYGTSEMGAYDSIEFMDGDKKELFYPGDSGHDSFQIN